MAVKSTVKKTSLALKLDNGTTATGAVKTVSVSMGSINKDAMDIEKAYNIALLIRPCLDKMLVSIEQNVTSALDEE